MSHQNPITSKTSEPLFSRTLIEATRENTAPELSISSNTSSNLRGKSLSSKMSNSNVIHKCTMHIEEDLQFYCFNNRTFLCGECLVKGGYADFEVTSLRKAAEKVKEKLNDLARLAAAKIEDFYLIEKEMEGHEAQIEKTIFNYKGEVKEKMDILRKEIDLKEREAIEKINRVHQEKLGSIRGALSGLKSLKEEVEDVKRIQEHKNDLSDFEVCQYYSAKERNLRDNLKNDGAFKIEKAKKMIETQQVQTPMCFNRFEEEFQKMQNYIRSFNVDIEVQRRPSPTFETPREEKEKESTAAKIERLSKFTSYYAQDKNEEKRNVQKESIKPQSQSPRQIPGQGFSFLNVKVQREESPAVKTPLAKQGTPRSTFLGEKKDTIMNREGSQKNLYQKSSVPIVLNSYKEMFSSKEDFESATPKGSAREVASISAINSYRSGMPSNKGLLDSFFIAGPQKAVKPEKRTLETSIDQISLCRTAPDFPGNVREQMASTGKLLGKNEGLGSFDFDNPFVKKGQNDVENLLNNENRLKQKLKKLNSQIFKY